jgi:ABC-2 type transport system permease protein
MKKIFWVAWREFSTTVFTWGFILGVVMTPVLILVVVGAMAYLQRLGGPRLQGEVAVIDRSGLVAPNLEKRFAPEAEKEEVEQATKQATEMIKQSPAADALTQVPGANIEQQAKTAIEQAAKSAPELALLLLAGDADAEKEKEPVKVAEIKTSRKKGEAEAEGPKSRLALAVIPDGAVRPDDAGKYTPIEMFFAQRLDGEIQRRIERRVQDSVVDARLANDGRLARSGLSPEQIRGIIDRPDSQSKTLTKEGEKQALGQLTMFIPMGFMILMMVSVMTSGSSLLTSTVEEKSSRVMEVLLSAVSPMQLMTGKILGQMAVGLLILAVYSGMGVIGIVFMLKRLDLITTEQLVYLAIFFFIAYFLIASMMAAIGSAVNDMREAQTLMTPVMLLVMMPWMIWFVIQRAPNSTLAVVLSFIPGMNPFIMVLRICGSEPVPTWQIIAGIGVGIVSVIFASWAAAKIFRIGALMYGKPPDFKTLVRWVRMA